ncbi:NAD(P)/FAD-dependent oxidoreductase [Candidatus Parcubacteria bacterium]|nr:MAG: NAD(P)/FAD-dependent oxidoreductase [Candidatus Parcubacteria bacterium]
MRTKKIVILGAGFGGLRAALLIGKKLGSLKLLRDYEVILVDRNEHHTYTPLLYEVATTSKETANIAKLHHVTTHSIWSLLEDYPIVFAHEEVENIDIAQGVVHFKDGQHIRYGHVVIALGSVTNYFNIKGLKENSSTLKTFKDAIRIRDTVWNLAMSGKETIEIVIGGGGSTGVELAAEFVSWCGELAGDFPKCRLKIKIVQAGRTVLEGFPENVIRPVEHRLVSLGVELIVNARIKEARKGTVVLADGRKISFDVLLWTGGITAPNVFGKLPLKTEPRGQLTVLPGMECLPQTPDLKLHSKIYALGDCVCLYNPKTQQPIPAVARAAIEQAGIVAHNIVEDVKYEAGISKKTEHKLYEPWEYPFITPVGGKYAVAKIGSVVVTGFWGWVLKGLVELNYLFSIMKPLRALKVWFKGLRIFIGNDRLG